MWRFPLAMNELWQPSDLERVKHRAVQAALQAGACAVRIAQARPQVETGAAMRASFARGDFATWPYDEAYAQKASDPSALLANAHAVLCVALSYAKEQPPYLPLRGRVSIYAQSEDYHARMRTILDAISTVINTATQRTSCVVLCDTKPLAERAFAARAGLGWAGKHTNVIAPGVGSYLFLGEVVTTLALPPDPPLAKSCGSCTRCVEACPTRALRGDYSIDATRCIADLTQRTDAIPRTMRRFVGDYIWGCDRCQEVCPPTMRAGIPAQPSLAPLEDDIAAPALTALLALRSGDFKRKFKRTAMGWRGAALLRRNAAVALGNALDRSAIPALGHALREDPHPLVRGHAAWALGSIGAPAAVSVLRERLPHEADPSVREEITAALEPFAPVGR